MDVVSIICLCYNHAVYIEEAIDSVYRQDYPAIELLVVNDASTDNSRQVIQQLKQKYPNFIFIDNQQNKGMCPSFNAALSVAKGDFIIDLAADDSLTPNRVSEQVKAFQQLDSTYGVVFSDAYLIDEKKKQTTSFYKRSASGKLLERVPEGDVFKEVVRSYRICSPTMMVRKKVFEGLGGYDESLSYEDYDFFIRSSRNYLYHFIDRPLVYKREVKGSASKAFYKKKNNAHLKSTLIVSKKALWLCRTQGEREALLYAVRYHYRQSYFLADFELALAFRKLIDDMGYGSFMDKAIEALSKMRVSVYSIYWVYNKVRGITS